MDAEAEKPLEPCLDSFRTIYISIFLALLSTLPTHLTS